MPNLPIPKDETQPNHEKLLEDYGQVASSVLGFIREHSSLLQSERFQETPADDLRPNGIQWTALLWAGAAALQWLLLTRS